MFFMLLKRPLKCKLPEPSSCQELDAMTIVLLEQGKPPMEDIMPAAMTVFHVIMGNFPVYQAMSPVFEMMGFMSCATPGELSFVPSSQQPSRDKARGPDGADGTLVSVPAEQESWVAHPDLPHSKSDNCQKCPDNEWTDKRKVTCIPKMYDFLSYEKEIMGPLFASISLLCSFVTIVVLRIFFVFRNTPIVKANNRSLSFILLVSIILSFLCVFLFLGNPVDITCMLRQTCLAVIFSVAVSSILGKTIMVCIAFKATKPGSSWRKWVGVKVSSYVVLMCTSVQVLINVIWLSISPPFQEFDMHSYPEIIIIQCNEGSVLAFYCVLGYMGMMASMSFVLAFMVRTLPDSFNEAKYITFSMLVFCSVWIAMIPAYLSTKGKYMVAVEIFAILASSAGILSCIYFPKCYILLRKPEINTRKHILDKHNS
ncbi:vomeronasal type-2 receptor 26-like [Pelobates fuscus]|uniref:vomeronasal type-2 receptor 26-like n=1 Tax=Pelobates fuscus TaxID=191477 RepID=UPI002FE439C8